MRIPNTKCSYCNKAIYKRPLQIEKSNKLYCSIICRKEDQNIESICTICNKPFIHNKSKIRKYCSKQCNGKANRHSTLIKNKDKTESLRRLNELIHLFGIESCMIESCNYNKIYEIHRFIPGKDGGKYEIGNMFAICPNHHAEIHRGICSCIKIDDKTLRVFYYG